MSFIHATETFHHFAKEEVTLERSKNIHEHKFLYDADDLQDLMSHFQEEEFANARLAEMGGIQGLAYALRSSTTSGLGKDEMAEGEVEIALGKRREIFGFNDITRQPPTPFWELCWNELEDPMLRVLIVAGIVSITIGAIEDAKGGGWIDGFAILIAVAIVVCVGGVNNFQKEKQFRAMEEESSKKNCIVLRGGAEVEIAFTEVVVGDLVVLRAGYAVPCDGVFVFGTEKMKTDESGLTGESRSIPKSRQHPLFMKGTQVVEGDGLMLATSVGDRTEWGQLMAKLQQERDETPLQKKLEVLGGQIGWGGTGVAIVLFLILLIRWAIIDPHDPEQEIVEFFIISVTIVVVAVPEGLPLAVTISLAYSMKKMLSDMNFVRHLQACETMGNATTICSDKTGTLTQNLMSVTKAYISNHRYFDGLPTKTSLGDAVYEIITHCICVNSKVFEEIVTDPKELEMIRNKLKKPKIIGGNQTECAMLQWVIEMGASNYKDLRGQFPVTKFFPFDSAVKRSSVLCKGSAPNRYSVYTKGAAEQVLDLCTNYMDREGNPQELSPEEHAGILDAMDAMTRTGLRCLGISYKPMQKTDIPFDMDGQTVKEEETAHFFQGMTWIGVVGIADPVRPEVPDAVHTCHKAGIVVRMVTGDHLETAKHIAKECHILTCKDHVCMTGHEFRSLTEEDKKKLLPKLRVLARSKPSDKEELVRWYKEENNDIVAVTGDGANDALALSKADVGLSMGIQGTDVAKEASDVIIMDDNFASIVKTVMWGRSVYDNIRKFVQFQLTVNVVALTISLIAAFWTKFANPLTPVQLLWVNLIMDTMAALALATEPPTMNLLNRNPYVKNCGLISKVLWRFIFGHSTFQLTVLLVTLFKANEWLDLDRYPDNEDGQNAHHLTVVFNVFVWMQIFNEINARRVQNEWNVFGGMFDNYYFVAILIITIVLQVLIVEFGGDFTRTKSLDGKAWAYCVFVGLGSLIAGQIVRLIPTDLNDGVLEVDQEALFREDPDFQVVPGGNALEVTTHNS